VCCLMRHHALPVIGEHLAELVDEHLQQQKQTQKCSH
jgi:hypothetical protein